MVISKPYGPALNKGMVEGREGSVRYTIKEGEIGLMPGFRYALEPAEIDAIIEYLKTVENPVLPAGYWVAEH
jgi:mono/diheme cytochrome c family protein